MKKLLFLCVSVLLMSGCGGKKVVESTYKGGKPNVVKYYEKVDGKDVLVREEIFFENGMKKMEGGYKEGQRDGRWTAWYEDGTLWSEGDYKNGKRNGPGIVYYRNGKKYIEGFYTNDLKSGVWHIYDEEGVILKEVNFDQIRDIPPQIDTID